MQQHFMKLRARGADGTCYYYIFCMCLRLVWRRHGMAWHGSSLRTLLLLEKKWRGEIQAIIALFHIISRRERGRARARERKHAEFPVKRGSICE